MEAKDLNLWSRITFKTQGYRKNIDFINDNENIITEYEGGISEVRISEEKPPITIGEYGFSVWNITLGKKLNVNFNKLIYDHRIEDTYRELIKIIKGKFFDINGYNKLVLVHTLIIKKDYRKKGVTQEFVEMLYRDFYDENTAIIALVKPFQNNHIDADFYFKRKIVQVKKEIKSAEIINIPAIEYYTLKDFDKKDDTELNEYKLFSLANSCGFNRLDDSYLFMLTPEKIVERIYIKNEELKLTE
jgi:hypothetical protein